MSTRTTRIDVQHNADIHEVRKEVGVLLTGIYDESRYPHSVLVDEDKEQVAQEQLAKRGILSSVHPKRR